MQTSRRITLVSLLFAMGASACVGGVSDGTSAPPPSGDDDGSSGSGTTTPPPTGTDPTAAANMLISQWSGCMTLTDFTTAKMNTAWGQMASSLGDACISCHGTGTEGFLVDTDATKMFTAISTDRDFLLSFFTPSAGKMTVNTALFQLVGTKQMPFQDHTPFDPTNNAGMTALQLFYTATMTQVTNGTCGAAKIPAM
jgi:hypothetical protein